MNSETRSSADLVDDVLHYFEWARENGIGDIVERIQAPRFKWDRFKALRELYDLIDTGHYDPYPFGLDWSRVMTPIEFGLWHDLRSGRVDMWPQYPVGRFFVDFADPQKKIAVECDGKKWHDLERDMRRDDELSRMGWSVFRLDGAECLRCWCPDFQEIHEEPFETCGNGVHPDVDRWLKQTSEGFIAALGVIAYGGEPTYYTREAAWEAVAGRLKNTRKPAWLDEALEVDI